MSIQQLRDEAHYAFGYLQGRSFSLTGTMSSIYGTLISKLSTFISLPLPLLSFLALPFFGSTTTSVNLVLFYLTWSTLVWTHEPLSVELYGTSVTKLLTYLLPSLGFLAFDMAVPSLAASTKARGKRQLPSRYDTRKLASVVGVSTFNVCLSITLQMGIELLLTKGLQMRSSLKVTTLVPTPWAMAKDLLKAFILRGVMHYAIHRYVLHAPARRSVLAKWHKNWAHSLNCTFSIVAAYDHPVCFLLAHWLPVYLPAVVLRLHVLTWLILLGLTSLEATLVYSGYAVLPSTVMLPGMAKRVDRHYETGGDGNFGHWGVLDWVCGTSCPGDTDVMDDLGEEADKHQMRRRVSDAVDNADGLVGDAKKRFGKKKSQDIPEDDDEDGGEGEDVDGEPSRDATRRSARKGKGSNKEE